MDPVWKITKHNTLFTIIDVEDFMMFMGKFPENAALEMIVRKPTRPSSDKQMRYYYGVVVKLIADATGHTSDETDSMLKWKFLGRMDDNNIRYVPSKTDLSTTEFNEYIEQVRAWAGSFLEIDIPDPTQVEIQQ